MHRPKSVTFAHCEGVVQGARNKEQVEGGGGMEAGQYRPSVYYMMTFSPPQSELVH